jgi:hypothetical protein
MLVDEGAVTLELDEAKSFKSVKQTSVLRQRLIDAGYNFNKKEFRSIRRKLATFANRQYDNISTTTGKELKKLVKGYKAGKASFTALSRDVKKLMHDAYHKAFMSGLWASGAPAFHKPSTTYTDRRYIDSAFNTEMKYMNRLLGQVRDGTVRGNTDKRLDAYVSTLKHQFFAGKVIGSPSGTLIDWICALDANSCRSCKYLSDHSPYTPQNIPCAPADGSCLCTYRCRCVLVTREVDPQVHYQVRLGGYSRDRYIRELEAIKSGKFLYMY